MGFILKNFKHTNKQYSGQALYPALPKHIVQTDLANINILPHSFGSSKEKKLKILLQVLSFLSPLCGIYCPCLRSRLCLQLGFDLPQHSVLQLTYLCMHLEILHNNGFCDKNLYKRYLIAFTFSLLFFA